MIKCPQTDSNRHQLRQDFKSCVSPNFTMRASVTKEGLEPSHLSIPVPKTGASPVPPLGQIKNPT